MPAEIIDNMLAYKGQEPWHGLGYSVPVNATGADMLNMAKLNWQVQRRSIAMRPGDGDRSRMLVDPLRGYRAIVRSDNDQVFQVATDRYQPVQNVQIVDFFREYCEAGSASLETVGGLKGGAIVWALARLNGSSNMVLDGVDELRGYMLLATSHDGSVRTVGKPTQIRVVCWNTLSAALRGAKGANEFRMKHTRKWTAAVAKEAQEVMGMAIEQVRETNELANQLSHVRLDGKGKVEFLRRLLNLDKEAPTAVEYDPTAEEVDRVLQSFESSVSEQDVEGLGRVGQSILEATYASPGSKMATADGTMWGMVNGVSFYSDHIRGRAQDSRLANAWFGAGDLLKHRALEVATEMAGIA